MFPSGAIKAVIVCGQLPSAAWQRLMMMMMRIGMMASNVDPTESTVQLLVCCLKKKHHQSHRIISNLDLCFPVGVLAMPKRKRRTRNGETVKLVTTLKHHIFFWIGSLGWALPWNILDEYYWNLTNQKTRQFTAALMDRMDDNCVQWIRKTGEFWPGGDIRISGNTWLRAAFTKSSLSKVPRENSIRQSLYEIIRKKKLRLQLSFVWCHAVLCGISIIYWL